MASTNKTKNYSLSQFVSSDKPTWLSDYNGDMSKIDTALGDIDTEMTTLKKSVSDGKTLVASAITDKGVETESGAAFEVMAENIEKIPTGGEGIKSSVISTSAKSILGIHSTVTYEMYYEL